MTDHPTWDDLNDLADGALSAESRARAERHLRECEECAAAYTRLGDLLRRAAEAPAAVAPPNEAWAAVRTRIDARRGLRLETGADDAPAAVRAANTPAPDVSRRFSFSVRRLAAAAVLLVTVSSAVTALLMRGEGGNAPVAAGSSTGEAAPSAARLASLPADVRATEREYLATADALEATLAEERGHLTPETIAVVERSLRVIDSAIVEARAALLRDPASADLRDLWSRSHRQKLDLLRRATELVRKT